MTPRIASVLFFLCVAAHGVRASDLQEDPAGQLSALLSGVQSYQATFRQQTIDGEGTELQAANGRMFAERPGRFRWEADAPFEQVMISDGESLWIHDVDLDQAVQRRLGDQLSNTPALLLSGDVRAISRAFTVSAGLGDPGEASFELRPRDPQNLFESMRVQFRDGALVHMHLEDSLGQVTRIEFVEVQVNPVIDPARFAFEAPPGTDLIIER